MKAKFGVVLVVTAIVIGALGCGSDEAGRQRADGGGVAEGGVFLPPYADARDVRLPEDASVDGPGPIVDAPTDATNVSACGPGTGIDTATDPINCGRCGRVCGAKAECSGGLCGPTIILDPPAGVSSNWCGGAFSATKAYMITCWGNNDLSELRTATLEPSADIGGTRIRHYTNVSVVALRGILIDGGNVYYGLEGNPSHLWKFPLDATNTNDVSIALTVENGMRFDALQLIGDTYYWVDNNHTAGTVVSASVYKRAKTDAASTALVTGLGLVYNLQVTNTKLLWLEARGTPTNVRLYRAPLAGAAVADVEELAVVPSGSVLVRRGDYVYWTQKSATPNGKIRRLKYTENTAQPEDIATSLNLPEGLISDEGYLYFKQLDSLYRLPLAGGAPERLSPVVSAHDTQAQTIFHVDEKYVYFDAGPGFGASTLVRVAK